jgi:hypothetical protein
MQWVLVQNISDSNFRRLVGVKRTTFDAMVNSFISAEKKRVTNRGRPSSVIIHDKILMMLMYYREYRTFLHVGTSFGISEAQCWRYVREVEEVLIKSKLFSLPGRKALTSGELQWEVVVVDVTESPVHRPKKNKNNFIQAKRKDIP